MCNDCKQQAPCLKDDCFEVITPKCSPGCENVVQTDCVFHNINEGDQSAKLFHLGITKGSSLKYILKEIDKKLSESINTDFAGFNMNGLNMSTPINNIKEFVDAITKKLNLSLIDIVSLGNSVEEIELDITGIEEQIGLLNGISVSSSKLNINATDTLKQVLNKVILYLEEIEEPIAPNFSDSSTIFFNETSLGGVSADVKISEEAGNIISNNNGLYAIHPSVSGILDTINKNAELKAIFTTLVQSAIPCMSFDIMATTNQLITYVNCYNSEATVTARANTLLRLNDVKRIITPPAAGLVITYKGIS